MNCQTCDEVMTYMGAIHHTESTDKSMWRWIEDFYCMQCHSSLTVEKFDYGDHYISTWVTG